MDERVLQAMARWPNVPNAFGWLSLDRRGQWLIKGERIGHAGLAEFIGRNYAADDRGRWYFQNGPQRVFVRLAAAPYVFRLDAGGALRTHTGQPAGPLRSACCDEEGALYLLAGAGFGVVDDRDLAGLLGALATPDGQPASPDAVLDWLNAETDAMAFRWAGTTLPLERVARTTLPARFGFDADPRPGPGEPEC